MSEMQSPEPASPPATVSDASVSMDPAARGNANLIYILYLVGMVVPIVDLVGVIMAYSARGHAPEWLESHYTNQVHVFWKGLLYFVVSIALSFIAIGVLLGVVALVWYVMRNIKGMQHLARGKPYPNPTSWGF